MAAEDLGQALDRAGRRDISGYPRGRSWPPALVPVWTEAYPCASREAPRLFAAPRDRHNRRLLGCELSVSVLKTRACLTNHGGSLVPPRGVCESCGLEVNWLQVKEAAAIVGVTPRTILNWLEGGCLHVWERPIRTGRRRRCLICKQSLVPQGRGRVRVPWNDDGQPALENTEEL